MDISVAVRSLLVLVQLVVLLLGVCLCLPEIRVREPTFNPGPRKVSYRRGEKARLFCSVRHLGERTVVWRKMSAKNPLTIGLTTWIGDPRIYVDQGLSSGQWDLIIEGVSSRDAGQYECQISMSRKMLRHVVDLFVLDSPSVQVKRNPEITITGSQFVSSGDDVSLFCNASMLGNPRRALVWLKDSVQVPTEGARVSWGYVVSPNRETLSAKLQITKARPDDSGLYTCRSRDHKLTTSAQVNVQSAGSNNVKRAGSVSQESSAVLSVQCAISNITFLTYMFFVHVLLT